METNDRRRARWLAVAAALIGSAAPAAGQSGDDLRILPSRPLPTVKAGGWPDLPPLDAPAGAPEPVARKAAAPVGGIVHAAVNEPSAELPPPDPPPTAGSLPAPPDVRNFAPAVVPPAPADRAPRAAAGGWKGNAKPKAPGREPKTSGRDGPRAGLAAPRPSVPRPEWSWHGYDAYNQNRPAVAQLNQPTSPDSAAELAPFMKYAHRWRPSSLDTTYPREPAAADTNTAGPAFPPADVPITPSVTVPLDADGPPAAVEPAAFRPPAAPPAPARPRVLVLPAPGNGARDRLPPGLREKIAALCTGKCRNLVIDPVGPARLSVRFLVKDPIDAEMLTNTLAALPELSAYKVEFEVQIGQ